MTSSIPQIESLHAQYGALTGYILELDYWRQECWHQWTRKGWNEADLRLVVRSIQDGIKNGRRRTGALKFNNLIAMTDRFEEDLAECRAAARVRAVPTARAAVLRATGRSDEVQQPAAQPVSEVALNILRDFRKTLE
jgi:hypothetical protein